MRNHLKQHKWILILTTVIILLPIFAGVLLWDELPEQVPYHWGINGEVDGWATKTQAVILMPAAMLAMQWLCFFLSAQDPKKQENGKILGFVLWIIPVLNLLLNVIVYVAARGRTVDIGVILPLAFGAMFVFIGNYLPKCKQSYTIGIKLPWTLNDEQNWNATHRLASKIWVGGGLLTMLCALLPTATAFIVMMVILLVMCIVPTVYSYRYYKKHKEDE